MFHFNNFNSWFTRNLSNYIVNVFFCFLLEKRIASRIRHGLMSHKPISGSLCSTFSFFLFSLSHSTSSNDWLRLWEHSYCNSELIPGSRLEIILQRKLQSNYSFGVIQWFKELGMIWSKWNRFNWKFDDKKNQ